MTSDQDLRAKYHVAKLALLNVRLLDRLETSDSEGVRALVADEVKQNDVAEMDPPKLLNQGTYLPFAYITLVWLWEAWDALEAADRATKQKELAAHLEDKLAKRGIGLPGSDRIAGPRPLPDWAAVLKLLRNSLSHGKVRVEGDHFVFADQNTQKPHAETGPTELTLTWPELGVVAECVLHALTPIAWPADQQDGAPPEERGA